MTAEEVLKQLWEKACEFDGIDPSATFVVFSDNNKYAKFYNTAMQQAMEATR